MKKGKKMIPILSVAAIAAVFSVSTYANAAIPGFSIQSFGRFEYDVNKDGTNEIVLDSADLRNLKSAIDNLDASTTQDITALKNQVDNDLAAKLEQMNNTFSSNISEMNDTFSNGLADEKKARKKADDAIYRILGMSNVDQETDDSGNVVERDDDGNVTRIIRSETTVNGTVITVTRYDISKTPEEFLDKVSYDTQTKKATTKEGSIIDPIIKVNEPEEGQITVIITNNDGTKSTIVYAEDTDLDDIEQYLKANGFTDEQIAIVRQLIADAINSGATTKQEIINYITNHTLTAEELQNLLKGLNAPSTDNEIGVTMDEVRAYLKTLVPTLSDEEITNVINRYLTIDGLTPEEIQIIINAMNDPSADADHSGLVTKAELEAYLGSVTSNTPEEIAKLAAAYINIPSATEINNYYKTFTPTEVNYISTAITEKYDDTVLKTSIKNVSDAQVSILDKIDNLKSYVDHGGNDMSYDGVRVKYTPKTDTSPAMAIFSPINPNSN